VRLDVEHPDERRALTFRSQGEGGLRIVTHFAQLAEAARQRCGVRPRNAIFENGATWIEGMRLTGVIAGESDDED
jgi:predicted ATPase